MEGINLQSDNIKQIQLFQKLIDNEIMPDKLRRTLMNLYMEYSQMVIEKHEKENYLPVDITDQLFYLSQIIKVCDGEEPIISKV